MAVRVGINGFGRIGRNVFRAAAGRADVEFVAFNDVMEPTLAGHLLRYDSVLGPYAGTVEIGEESLVVDGRELKVLSKPNPGDVDWAALGVQVVVEASGKFTKAEQVRPHIDKGGAQKVVVTAPTKGEDITVCMGINDGRYDPARHQIISNASCTTNCLAPVAKVLHESFGIESALMTTAHAYTGDQRLLDSPHHDFRRSRAAALSIIPTTTGAAKAVALVLPELEGKFAGMALRVPVPNVSLIDLSAQLSSDTTAERVNQAMREAAAGSLRGILAVTDEELVSIDFRGNSHSSIFDAPLTTMAGPRHVKVLSWYDNEWGYSCRVVDLLGLIGKDFH